MKYFLRLICILATLSSFAQAPVINEVRPLNAGPNQKVVITGNGFSTDTSKLKVWFDHVKGKVTASTIYSLEVQVPAQARFSNLEVINLGNNLSAKSKLKFLPSYGGVQFDVAKTAIGFTNSDPSFEMFDVAGSDLDLDGKPDLVATRGGPAISAATDLFIFRNTTIGSGNAAITFTRFDKTSAGLSSLGVGAPTVNVACGDLNGDGKPDILASRGGSTRNEVFVLKNTNTTVGTMAFASQAKLLLDVSQIAFRISIRDLNGDGKPEVIVSNSFDDLNAATDNQIYIFPNQSTLSTISFGTPIKLNVTGANSTYGLEVQDLDGDSRPDIIVNQFQDPDVFIFRNTSTGNISFDPVQKVIAAGKFIQIISSDLNNDGLLDLIATATLDNNMQIWINKSTPGTISFNASQTLTTSKGPWGVDVSDIDGDGDADIIVANKNAATPDLTDVKMNIFRQDASLSFTRLDFTTTSPTRNLRVGDFDGDGKPDIAFTAFAVQAGQQFTMNVLRNANCWKPVITGSSTTICSGQTIPLQTQPALGASFSWSPQSSATNSLNATAAGTYTVTLTGTVDTGCINTSPGYTLTQDVNTFPSDPVISNNVPCLNSSLNLSTAAVATATYQWTGPNNFSSTQQNPTIAPVQQQSAGNYNLQVTLSNGCQSNVVTKLLDVASVPVLPVTATPSATGCTGGNITLSVTGSGYTFQWNKDGSAIGGQTGTSLSLTSLAAANEGDYSVSVTSTANSCTQETAKTTVRVLSAPVPGFSFSNPQCKGQSISFADQSTFDSRGTLTYKWTFDGVNISSLQNPSFTYNTANSYSPNLLVSYGGACPNNVAKPLTVNAPVVPKIQTTANPICVGDQTTLSVTGNFNSFNWVGVSGTTSSVAITQPALYKVNTVDANGCASKDSLTINLKPTLSLVATAKRTAISVGDTTQLIATAGADSYLWSPGKTLNDSIIANPIAKPLTTTAYIVVGKKTGFCNASDTVTVNVDTGGAVIKPPVLFSPNGDTINDTWQIPDATNYPDWIMTIYDGHGSKIYQQKGYNSTNAWDGNFSGKASPDGTYFYVFSNSKDKPATGSVLVVR
ncbi:MAG: VCBS repeat-containing protein [Bacteroidetes bacterium]|nr:VCBS repeat-containing protein [Bacteroidota bacterium]